MCDRMIEKPLGKFGDDVVDLAISNVEAGGLPFAAIIVNQAGEVIGRGVNEVARQRDCTAHAEIQAIRRAARRKGSASLKGTTLIASGEPCALCYMAIRIAEVSRVAVLADRYEAQGHGFDYLWTYRYLNESLLHDVKVVTLENDRKLLPFELAGNALGG